MSEHIIRRGARYYYRRRVPTDLIELYGKTEVQRALGTSERRDAERKARLVAVEFDAIFERLRNPHPVPTTREADTYEPLWISTAPMQPKPRQQVEDEEELDRLQREDEAREERLAELEEVVRKVLSNAIPIAHGQSSNTPTATGDAPASHPVDARGTEKSLDRLVRLWEKARQPSSRSAATFHRTVMRFNEMVGRILVPRITKVQIVQFKDAMVAAEVGDTAINASLDHMRTLCRFAIGQAWIDINPATGVKLEVKKRGAKGLRPPFDLATLNRIFSNRVYTEKYRPPQGVGEAGYWLPLLGLYTGARLEELCQLRPEDIHEDTYRDATGKENRCWVLRITDSEHGQGIKNAYSRRRIPIHAELLKRGFLKYAQRHKGKPRIFPGMKLDNHGSESAVWSQWWIRLLRRECAPTSPKMVYHSFRHTFKDACRECGITKELADALQGHSEGDAAGNYGAEFYPLRPLVEAMDKYVVHGLKLPAS